MGKTEKYLDDNYGINPDDILDGLVEAECNYVVNERGNYVLDRIIIISGFRNKERYEAFIETLIVNAKKYLSEGADVLKKMKVVFKFDYDDKAKTMPYMRFVFNIIMWRPYFEFQVNLDDSAIFNPEYFHNKKYADYFNAFADKHRDIFTAAEFSESLFWVQVYMNKLVVAIGPLFGNSISIYDMVKMAKRNADVNSIIHTEVDASAQPREIEEFLAGQTDRLFKILLSERSKNNPLKPFIRAGVGVQKTQVCETMVNVPLKPSLDGETIPIISNTNLMTNGLNTPMAVYIDAAGGRKASIVQKGVASSGYFSRNSTYATSDITLSDNPNYSCNTKNYYKRTINSTRELALFEGRFYKVGKNKFKIITLEDTHLVGQEIELRSPVTCACKDNKVCKACYGTLYNVNYGIHAAMYSAIELNEGSSQVQLSAKHALNTVSTRVRLVDDHMFLTTQNSWLFTLNDKIDRSKYELVFINNDVNMIKKENYDKYDNYYIHHLVFRNIQTKETFEVYEESDCLLYLSNQLFRRLDKSKFFLMKSKSEEEVTIPLLEFDTNEPFVFLRITNKELAAPIKKLKKFIQSGKKPLENMKDYHEFITTVSDLYRTGGIDIPSVHVEMLLRNLIRDINDEQSLPNWEIEQTPDMYRLLSLNASIINNASAICSLLFEQQKRQLRGTSLYRKSKSSIHSLLFYNE